MARENFEDIAPDNTAELIASFRESILDLEDRVRKVSEDLDDASASIRLEIAHTRRELVEVRSALLRLQSRFDNQVVTLVLCNIASGVGVAALVLGAAHAFS
jgi:predicted  nucleic acid-binding Zn-ribbon protein